MPYAELSEVLEGRLRLRFPPTAVAFVQEQPSDVPRAGMALASPCAFWRQAESEVFFASAEDHFRCPVGAMIMGFALPEPQMRELQEEVAQMCSASYVREVEVGHIPKVEKPSSGIVYGPLSRFPVEPDAVILWLTPQQAMVMGECCGLTNWAAAPQGVFGRPGCAAIPLAMAEKKPSQSWGCVGMRLNTDIPEELFLMAIPGDMLHDLGSHLIFTTEVHRRMRDYYLQRAARPLAVSQAGPGR